jgi:hypothetical protein
MEQKKRGRPPGKPKTGGRKAGTPNKISTDLRKAVHELLDQEYPILLKNLNKMPAKDIAMLFDRLLSYSLPKLQASTIEATVTGKMEQLNEVQLNKLIEKILEDGSE